MQTYSSKFINTVILIILLPIAVYLHWFFGGVIERYIYYFAAACFLFPVISRIKNKSFKVSLIESLVFAFFAVLAASLYWAFRDKAFMPKDYTCDGPCFGWFSFENQLDYFLLIKSYAFGLLAGWLAGKFISIRTYAPPL